MQHQRLPSLIYLPMPTPLHSTRLDSDLLLGGRRLLETGTECRWLRLGYGKQGAKLDVLGVGPVQLRLELLQ